VGDFTVAAGKTFNADDEFYITNGKSLTLEGANCIINNSDSTGSKLLIDIGDPYDGRAYVQYSTNIDTQHYETEQGKFTLPTAITASFLRVTNVVGGKTQLALGQSNVVYVNQNFNGVAPDGLGVEAKGKSADYPYASIYEAYNDDKVKSEGGLIYIVDTYVINENVTLGSKSYSDASGKTAESPGVSFKRYSQPDESTYENNENFNNVRFETETHTEALFKISSGATLTLDNVNIDGHSSAVPAGGKVPYTQAAAVVATEPIVLVESGNLVMTNGAALINNNNTGTATKGDAINNGDIVRLDGSESVNVGGSVYLQTGKFITVNSDSVSPASSIIIEMELSDAYDGRVIGQYNGVPDKGETGKYSLPDDVAELYKLVVDEDKKAVVLRTNRAVYVDGRNGDDSNVGTPKQPLRSLFKAYQELSAHGGTIYIVDTVTIGGNRGVSLSPTMIIDGESVLLDKGKVEIVRYSQPDAWAQHDGFDRASNQNALISIEAGSSLTLSGITVDGHSNAKTSGDATVVAGAVGAIQPAIRVAGTLEMMSGAKLSNNNNTAALAGAIMVTGDGTVSMHSGAELSGNYGNSGDGNSVPNGIYLNGQLRVSDSVKFNADQWVYANGETYVEVVNDLDAVIPVELPSSRVNDGTVIAKYAGGLTPDESEFELTEANKTAMEANSINKLVDGQNVILAQSFKVDYVLTNLRTTDTLKQAASGKTYTTTLIPGNGAGDAADFDLPLVIQSVKVKAVESYSIDASGKLVVSYVERDILPGSGADQYQYDPATGSITIGENAVIGDITITAVARDIYNLGYEAVTEGCVEPADDNLTRQTEGVGFTLGFTPAAGFENLVVTEVTMGGVKTEDYSIGSTDEGVLTVTMADGKLSGDVVVKLNASYRLFDVVNEIDGTTMTGLPEKVKYHEGISGVTVALVKPEKYEMPDEVTAWINGVTKLDSQYVHYNKTTGDFSIDEGHINGHVFIRGVAPIKNFAVEYKLTNLEKIDDAPTTVDYDAALSTGIKLSDSANYVLPSYIEVSINNGAAIPVESGVKTDGISYYAAETEIDTDEGQVTMPAGSISFDENVITGKVVITAAAVKLHKVSYVYSGNELSAKPNNTQVQDGLAYTGGSITAEPGYRLNVTVTMGGNGVNAFSGTETLNKDITSGSVSIEAVTGDVVVNISTVKRVYSVTEENDKYDVDVTVGDKGNDTVEHGSTPTIVIEPVDGYLAPKAEDLVINVYDPDTGELVGTLDENDYTYTVDQVTGNGTITITDGTGITGPIVISGAAVPREYKVTYKLGSLLIKNSENTPTQDAEFVTSIKTNSDKGTVTLPETITVKIADKTYNNVGSAEYTSDISYDSSNGNITIPGNLVNGDVTIEACGVQSFAVSATITNGKLTVTEGEGEKEINKTNVWTTGSVNETNAANTFTGTVSANDGYANPDSVFVEIGDADAVEVESGVTVTVDSNNAEATISYNKSSGRITVSAEAITDDVHITAQAIKLHTVSYTTSTTVSLPSSSTVENGKPYSGSEFSAAEGYRISSVVVTMGTVGELTNVYTATKSTGTDELAGKVTIDAVTGDVTITVSTVRRQYTVTNTDLNTDIEPTDKDNDGNKDKVTVTDGRGEDGTVEIPVIPDPGYDYPENVTIKVIDPDTKVETPLIEDKNPDDGIDNGDFTYNPETGEIVIDKDAITGNIEITSEAKLKEYTIIELVVDAKVTDVTDSANPVVLPVEVAAENPYTVTHGQSISLQLEPLDSMSHTYPDTVTVSINGSNITGFDYNKTTGELTIPTTKIVDGKEVAMVDGPVVIGGKAELNTYKVSCNITNLDEQPSYDGVTEVKDNNGTVTGHTVRHKQPTGDKNAVTITLSDTNTTGYDLPETVTVEIGGTKQTVTVIDNNSTETHTGITYNKDTGVITIPKDMVTGDIAVSASGKAEEYTVTYRFSGNNGTAMCGTENVTGGDKLTFPAGYSAELSANTGYRITGIEVLMGGESQYKNDKLEDSASVSGIITGSKTGNQDYTELELGIAARGVTGDLIVNVTLAKRQYEVKNTGDNTQIQGDDDNTIVVEDGTDNITIVPDTGYEAPDTITVTPIDPETGKPYKDENGNDKSITLDKNGEAKDGYRYTVDENGNIVVTPTGGLDKPIIIDANGKNKTYNVSFDFEPDGSKHSVTQNGTSVINADNVHVNGLTFNTEYSVEIAVDRGWKIDSITVKRGESSLTENTHFSYDKQSDGKDTTSTILTVVAAQEVGDIEVTVYASRRQYSISENIDDKETTGDNATVEIDTDGNGTSDGTVPPTGTEPGSNAPKVEDGDDVTLIIKPDDEHDLPDEITVTIKDPDGGGEDKTVTIEKGETDPDTGIKYTEDGKVIIPEDTITGPVEISGEALQKFNVSAQIKPVEINGTPDYARTESTNDITYSGNGENVATESKPHELTITAQTGYSIVSIDVTVKGTTVNVPVKSGEAAPTGYSYSDNKLTIPGSAVEGDIEVTVITERTRYDVAYQLQKDGKEILVVAEGYRELEDNNVPIHGADFTTMITKGNDPTITLPETITVKINGETLEAKQTDAEGNETVNYTYNKDTGEIVIKGHAVTGNVQIIAVGVEKFEETLAAATLTASDVENAPAKTAVVNLETGLATEARLKDKVFKVTYIKFVDDDTSDNGNFAIIESNIFDAEYITDTGSIDANTKFAITATINGNTVELQKDAQLDIGNATKLELKLHNANALTAQGKAGHVELVLTSYDKSDKLIGDTFTLTVNVERIPSQLNVTVPLVLVMKTNIDGGSVDMANSSYAIENKSSMRVQLTDADVANMSGNTMSMVGSENELTGVDQFYVGTIATDSEPDYIAANGTCKPITKVATSPLSFVTKDDAEYGLHMATVTYTVKIPEN